MSVTDRLETHLLSLAKLPSVVYLTRKSFIQLLREHEDATNIPNTRIPTNIRFATYGGNVIIKPANTHWHCRRVLL